jgi:putative ABC transport system ATP-binding protein
MISLQNVTKRYNIGKPNELAALNGVTLEIDEGEMLAVMGRSGAGKSTLVHIIGCLENITTGKYLFQGEDVGKLPDARLSKIRNSRIGILLQNFVLLQHQTALENCMVPLYFNPVPFSKMKKKAEQALERIGIADLRNQVVGTMSGGQQQRVALARAIVCGPQLVIADEPTGALDSHTADGVMEELKKLNDSGTTIIIVTHDQSVADRCGRMIRINDGRLMEAEQ